MNSELVVSKREHLELAFDACLITAGIFALLTSVALGVVAAIGLTEVPTWLQVMSSMLLIATGVGGPLITWGLYRRRITPISILGAVLGMGAAGVLTASLALLSAPLAWIVRPISESEFAGPVALLAIVGTAFVGMVVWLLVDAARDSMPQRRTHRVLDTVRLISALAIAALAVGVTLMTIANPAVQMGEALIFALVTGISGGMIVAGADLMSSYVGHENRGTQGASPA